MRDPIGAPSLTFSGYQFRRSLQFAVLVLMVMAIHCEAHGRAAKVQQSDKPKACAIREIEVDPAKDVHALEEYKQFIAELLREERFEEIDCLADAVRSQKARFAGGMWKIHTLYWGLQEPHNHATEEDWKDHLARLQSFVTARPDSITARVALAKTYMDYAWNARGNGYSDTVSESGWRLFGERLAKAEAILGDASSLPTKCPEWYLAMQGVAQGQGWELEQMTALLQRAIAFEPGYYYFYRIQVDYLLPKWHGEEGDSEKFAAESADQIGGAKGDALYFQLAVTFWPEKKLGDMSWPRIQKGFSELEKQYGPSLLNQNFLAGLALRVDDPVVADAMFKRIGENWDQETWGTEAYFKRRKEYAATMAPYELRRRQIHDAADANMHTPEGVEYMKPVNQKVTELLRDCIKTAGGELQRFQIMLQIGKDGILEGYGMENSTPVAICVLKQFGEARMNKQPSFSPPPHPAYWVVLDLDPAAMNVARK